MIFQEPMSSLSPVHTVGDQIMEVLRLHLDMTKAQARARCIELGAFGVVQLGAQHRHRLGAVLVLRALLLHEHHDAAR